ncbi:hypothetical protein L3Q82_000724 [Scortum barcoo]|uniref:Uncharacterized protein n=1 Tax=Scortum barcoo TaxID=214431 RepID=A0ACB8WDG1_9TELE|nr:hypothetical protein L3Q82_000724 [Scortum barcoo]
MLSYIPVPFLFFSHRLSPAEANYDISNQDLLVVKLALEEWRQWLESAVWSHIVLDFITGLPPSNGNSVILTIIDGFSKATHFVALAKLPTAREVSMVYPQTVSESTTHLPDDKPVHRQSSLFTLTMSSADIRRFSPLSLSKAILVALFIFAILLILYVILLMLNMWHKLSCG